VVSSITVPYNWTIQHIEVILTATYEPGIGKLFVVLASPMGTLSRLAETHRDSHSSYNSWTFTSVRHWEETSLGEWQLRVVRKI